MWTIVRLANAALRPASDLFCQEISRLKKHSQLVDQTAVAVELLRASDFRDGKSITGFEHDSSESL